ncbi:hypothetical protein D9Q98_008991 [Chlorella vulgaris]|uniref:Uncharacterized protein n=1 Tax=Chlorella vulgaris TaxID=3077 RepID=A0A9D4TH38_CHLVU|nr:hypothetical protein D9Q98_008991 [Chlorella vulgaris]
MSAALHRLRQGRCQLLSLVQWHQAQACGAQQLQQRDFAAQAPDVQFARERKGFENELSKLRKQWADKRLAEEAVATAAAAKAKAAIEAKRARRMQQDIATKERRKEAYQIAQAAELELRTAAKAERLKRAELRAEVLDVAREERRRRLLRLSCKWVTPQALDERIQEALDNPLPLHAE